MVSCVTSVINTNRLTIVKIKTKNPQYVTILAIESSCDDTSAAILRGCIKADNTLDIQVLSNCIANQSVHEQYGGVVPELASRAHQANIVPTVDLAFKRANVTKQEIDAIAFTRGPGLMGSLLVGVSFAKAMSLAMNVPMIEVNHMSAHVLAHFSELPHPTFPFLCLTVSGGHTQIVRVNDPLSMEVLGETIDDAAGEAFDKSGKILGLGYPAGPIIDKLAKQGIPRFEFTEPHIEGYNFSFSGLKTAILYFLQKKQKENPHFVEENLNDICASIQARIISILMKKLKKAAKETGINHIAIAGGVSANSGLREALTQTGITEGWQTYIPSFQFCTDNAGMIATAAFFKFWAGDFVGQDIAPLPRMAI
ncbi:MAG: tRNA (adenosine(37)-N6)-threonylcarbamoyltransferase complex transferase subunit TsaD [Saprospiraceae bacterium]|nr:tRNA (adenosine(37)-N6)-threonylcarbamoyltransferase complex transferase subunit TsaD [Saprospiraceae bacterium]